MSVKAFCLINKGPNTDYKFRGVFFIKEDQLVNGKVPQDFVRSCLMSNYTVHEDETGRETAKTMVDEELPHMDYFWIDLCAAMRIQSVPLPPTGTDSAHDAVMDMLLAICDRFRVDSTFFVQALTAVEYESRFVVRPLLRCPICLNDKDFVFLFRPDAVVGVRVEEGELVFDKPEITETPEEAGIVEIQCAECDSIGKPCLYGYEEAPKTVSGGLGPSDDFR